MYIAIYVTVIVVTSYLTCTDDSLSDILKSIANPYNIIFEPGAQDYF